MRDSHQQIEKYDAFVLYHTVISNSLNLCVSQEYPSQNAHVYIIYIGIILHMVNENMCRSLENVNIDKSLIWLTLQASKVSHYAVSQRA